MSNLKRSGPPRPTDGASSDAVYYDVNYSHISRSWLLGPLQSAQRADTHAEWHFMCLAVAPTLVEWFQFCQGTSDSRPPR